MVDSPAVGVLQVGGDMIPTPSRAFFGGLHSWTGADKPTESSIAGSALLHVGVMHIRAIVNLGGEILGCRSRALDSIAAPVLLSSMGGAGTMVLQGATSVRPAERAEWGRFPVLVIGVGISFRLSRTRSSPLFSIAMQPAAGPDAPWRRAGQRPIR